MKIKRTISAAVIFVLGSICGAILYFVYINGINRIHNEETANRNIEKNVMLYWDLKYNKVEYAKKELAEEIRACQKTLQNTYRNHIDLPTELDSSITKSLEFVDTEVQYTSCPYKPHAAK
jgi:archaellum component FlaF (FlaF/FlaG flagellin family)